MQVFTQEETMAKSKGRPKTSGRDDITVKMARKTVSKAKHLASYRGVSVAELLTGLVDGPLDKAYGQMLREIEKRETGE